MNSTILECPCYESTQYDNEQHFTDSMEVYGSSWKEWY
jgi:hypothetical protein